MISSPVSNNFRFSFHKTFIRQEVKEKFKPYFNNINRYLFGDINEYLNSTVSKVVWPGIADETITQYGAKKDGSYKTRRMNTAKSPEELIEKNLDVYFSVKEGYYNWLILYSNLLEQMKHNSKSREKFHLPECYLQVLDDAGSIIMQIAFQKINFVNLEKMEFNTQDTNIVNKDFSLSLTYTDFDMRFYMDGDLSEKGEIIV